MRRHRTQTAERSEFGWQVAVDLKADTDFDESGRSPSHGFSSYVNSSGRVVELCSEAEGRKPRHMFISPRGFSAAGLNCGPVAA
jgi:hypothetical protein